MTSMKTLCSCSMDDKSGWWILIKYHPRKHLSMIFTKIFNVEIISEYTFRYTESCVWISVFDVISKNPVFKPQIVDRGNE